MTPSESWLLAVGNRYASTLADQSEMIDAVGSKWDGPVEAAEWKRLLYRGVFGVATVLAVLWTLAGVIEAIGSLV